jgi:membrane AbrB-like protein
MFANLSQKSKLALAWPVGFRNAGLIVLGYMLGISFTREAGWQILTQLPSMFLATVFIIFCGLILGVLIARQTGISLPTSLVGSIPGGLTQMVVLAEEIENIDITTVTFIQTIRLLTVVFTVPFLSLHFLAESPAILTGAGAAGPDAVAALGLAPENILAYGIAVLLSTAISVRLGFPTPYLIGPLIGAAALVLWGWPAPTVPPFLITFAQVAVGAYMGLSMNLVSLQNWRKLLPYSLGFGLGIVFLALGIGYCLTLWHPLNLLTAFLATAPGGMTEMGVTAVAAGADLSVVAAYQLFRVLFILFVVPILLKWGLPKLTAARLNRPGP